MVLEKIVASKKKRLTGLKEKSGLSELERAAALAPAPRDFIGALKHGPKPAMIAEIKKASPSAGLLRPGLNVSSIAASYERAGAAAISVITEEDFFQGKLEYLEEARQATSLPILCKDFIIDPVQVLAARAATGDALLLIAAVLEQESLVQLLGMARSLGMACLVEVHNAEELSRVLATDARIIGINNRNLRTFEVSLETTTELRSRVPSDRLVVSESGIHQRSDIQSLARIGVDAVLVGTSLMRSDDPGRKLKQLMGRT